MQLFLIHLDYMENIQIPYSKTFSEVQPLTKAQLVLVIETDQLAMLKRDHVRG